MKTTKIYSLTMIISLLCILNISFAQEWESTNYGYRGNNIEFLNSNTGFIGLTIDAGTKYAIYKTINKGLNFSQIWSTPKTTENSKGFGFDMINESIGYLYVKSTLYRTSNGGITWDSLSEFLLEQSIVQSIKFYNDNVGFITFTPDPISSTGHIEVWRITNGGHNRSRVYSSPLDQKVPVVKDIAISNDGNKIVMTGFYKDFPFGSNIRFFSLTSDNGGVSFIVQLLQDGMELNFQTLLIFQTA